MKMLLKPTALAALLFSLAHVAQAGMSFVKSENDTPTKDKLITVTDCQVQTPLPAQTQTAAFATIENKGEKSTRLVAVVAPQISESISIHEMKITDGTMEMAAIPYLTIDSGKTELKKGSYHIMLEDLQALPQKGTEQFLLLNFIFSNGENAYCRANIVNAKDMVEHAEHDHDHKAPAEKN